LFGQFINFDTSHGNHRLLDDRDCRTKSTGHERNKTPNTNIQAPEKFQTSRFQAAKKRPKLIIGFWCFSGAWMLELGAFFQPSQLV
jgi:hypothetical protein